MQQQFEAQLIFHGAPVLSGKKPANLICFLKPLYRICRRFWKSIGLF